MTDPGARDNVVERLLRPARESGERYRAMRARSGVDLRLVSTAGDADNLAKLRDARSGVDVAMYSGVAYDVDAV